MVDKNKQGLDVHKIVDKLQVVRQSLEELTIEEIEHYIEWIEAALRGETGTDFDIIVARKPESFKLELVPVKKMAEVWRALDEMNRE